MAKSVEKARRWCAVLMVAGVALGCSVKKPDGVTSSNTALSTSNGIGQNGLWSNGLWSNGLWSNGLWSNGLWSNGLWSNGLWSNGLWSNGLWSNGLWSNGLWSNGLWSNGLWSNGLTGDAAVPGDSLRSSSYTRQLLQYIYACAMPPSTYDTSLDPNGGTLLCSAAVPCDDGYACSTEGTCVVPLKGMIGVGINADGTSWGASGKCDETCQRWVSACILARTNAYGVHVEISMRAPADAPQAIKNALAVTGLERTGDATHPAYTLREGAYYGNLFATTPVDLPPAPDFSGPATGPIASTPTFTACAGPGSNIPQLTKRFCSSQGDQVVINVPGLCLSMGTQTGVCEGEDIIDTSPTFGAIQDCYTGAGRTGTHYDEVITVYLKQPIAVCGNDVCEAGEDEPSCRSDCHPGWTKDFGPSYGFGGGLVDATSSNFAAATKDLTAVSPVDDTVVVVGKTENDLDFGDGTLAGSDGYGVLVKLDPADGHHLWSKRFKPDPAPAPGFEKAWNVSGGVTVDANGNITVLGTAVDTYCVPNPDTCINAPVTAIWVNRFSPTGDLLQHYSVPTGNPPAVAGINAGRHYNDLTLTRAVAADGQGNILLAGGYCGDMRIPRVAGMIYLPSDCSPRNYDSQIGNGLFVAKLLPPTFGSSQGSFAWAKSLATGAFQADGSIDLAGYAGLSLSVDRLTDQFVLLTGGAGGQLLRMRGADGSQVWQRTPVTLFSVATVDGNGDTYVSGTFARGANFNCGANAPDTSAINGRPPYLMKIAGTTNACLWVKTGKTICPQDSAECNNVTGPTSTVPPQVEGVSISFDRMGNPILGSFGNPIPGGGLDFGFGTFPAYASNNIFVSAYDSATGTPLWAKHVPTVLSSLLIGMDLDSQGRVVMSGNYSGSMLIDDRLLVTGVPELPDVIDSFVASFNTPSLDDATAPEIGATTGTLGQLTPVYTVPKPVVTPATSGAGATVFFMPPTAIDAGGAGTSVVCSPRPNTIFPVGTTRVTCTASDPLGNTSSASFDVTVTDKLSPLFGPLPDVTAQAPNDASPTFVSYAPTAVDQVDGPVAPTCVPASGSAFPVGPTTVTCTAKDARNNTSKATFTVTVKPPIAPNTPPVVTVPANLTVTAVYGSTSTVVAFSALAIDTQDGALVPVCAPASGSPFPIGTTTVSCTATDSGGLSSTKTFTVTVLAGLPPNTPPVVTVPANLTVEATSASGARVNFTATATDAQDGARPVTCSPASGTTFAIGTKTVTCTATDTKGLSASKSFTVTVKDSKGPTFCDVPGTIKAYATSKAGAKVTFGLPHANDAIDGARPVTCTPASGAQFPVNKTTVTCTASDKAGNKATATFTVWVTYQAPTDGTFFLVPVRSNGSSVFKIGRPVPARFKLTGASAGITDLVAKLTVTKLSNTVQGTVVDPSDETVDDTDSIFKYRPLLRFYAYRWKTRDQTQGTFQLKADLGDGVTHQVNVSLRP